MAFSPFNSFGSADQSEDPLWKLFQNSLAGKSNGNAAMSYAKEMLGTTPPPAADGKQAAPASSDMSVLGGLQQLPGAVGKAASTYGMATKLMGAGM